MTDYLHTGWWPTFNLADVSILTAGVVAALVGLRPTTTTSPDAP